MSSVAFNKKGGGDTRKYVDEWFDFKGGLKVFFEILVALQVHTRPSMAEVCLRYIHFKARSPVSLYVLANWHGPPRPWFPKCGPGAKRSQVGKA